jgi:hypothetical protein
MVRHAFDGDVPPTNADDAFDDADIDIALVENRALFDVQLDVRFQVARLATRIGQSIGIAADRPDAVANGLAAVALDIECVRLEMTGHCHATDRAALLVREYDDFERMLQANAALLQRPCNFDRSDHADVAVVVAAARHGVDVRADHDWGKF